MAENNGEVKAYYRGRNDHFYGDAKRKRGDFQTQAEFESYKRGWRHSAGESKLDQDTDWDE